jgi:hypothetical protein
MTSLYRYRRRDASLSDCLAAVAANAPLHGYCHSPRWTRFGACDGRGLLTFAGQESGAATAPLDQIYEARFFCDSGELRWLRDPESDGTGQGAWVSEVQGVPEGFESIDTLDGLTAMTGQIAIQHRAELPAPLRADPAAYVIREYIARAPGQAGQDGNCMVVEQRILRIAPWTGTESGHD